MKKAKFLRIVSFLAAALVFAAPFIRARSQIPQGQFSIDVTTESVSGSPETTLVETEPTSTPIITETPTESPHIIFWDMIYSVRIVGEGRVVDSNGKSIQGQIFWGDHIYSNQTFPPIDVLLTAIPAEGYRFAGWSKDYNSAHYPDDIISTENTYIITHAIGLCAWFVEIEKSPSPECTATPSSPPSDTPYIEGDANCDGEVNIQDILLVRDVIFGDAELSAQGRINLNLGPDDDVTIEAILFIRDMIFGTD